MGEAKVEKRREVPLEGHGNIVFVRPDVGISKKSEWKYSKTFNNAIKDGIFPTAILQRELEHNGLWGRKDEQEIEDQRAKLTNLTEQLKKEGNETKRKDLKKKYLDVREELFILLITKQTLFANSAEQKAEEEKAEYLMLNCCYKDGGKEKLWKSVDEMLDADQASLYDDVSTLFIGFLNDLPNDLDDLIPEGPKEKNKDEKPKKGDKTK